ncbi:MAG: tetratricopeptide repeat protein [Kiritimatiellales bacterium]|nr:tetratricopeptide repeat protein [Kiritimatiellales bacterium]
MKVSRKVWLWLVCAMVFFATVRAEDSGESIYQQGMAVYESNPAAAYGFFLEAAGKGHVQSMIAMGHCCETGSGIATNWSAAVGWYGMAMKKDPVKTCQGLGAICALARGIKKGGVAERVERFEANSSSAAQIYEAAMRLLAEGKSLDASDLLDRSFAKFPNDQRLLFMRGVLWRSRFDKLYTSFFFYCVQALDASSSVGKAADTVIKMDRGVDVVDGFQMLRSSIQEHPDDLLLRWLFAIQCREHRTHSEAAAEQYEIILEQWDVGPSLVHQTYGNILDSLGLHEKALVHRKITVELEPKSWSYNTYAITLNNLKRYEEADRVYAKCLELEPGVAMHLNNWANNFYDQERYNEAIEKYKEVLEADPNYVRALVSWGECLSELDRKEEAFAKCRQACQIDPDYAPAWNDIGFAYEFGQGAEVDYQKAMDAYRKAAEKNSAWAMYRIARMYVDKKGVARDYEAANDWCRKAAERGNIEAMDKLAWNYSKGREGLELDPRMAVHWYQNAAESGSGDAYLRLGGIYRTTYPGFPQDIGKAIECYQAAAKHGLSLAHQNLARVYASSPEPQYLNAEKALIHATAELETNPENPVMQDIMAMAYARDGQFEKAIASEEKGIEIVSKRGKLPAYMVKTLERYKQRLELYKQNKPYVQKPTIAPTPPSQKTKVKQTGRRSADRETKDAIALYKALYEKEHDGAAAYHIAKIYQYGGRELPADPVKAVEWHHKAIEYGFPLSHSSLISLHLSTRCPELWDVGKALQHAQILEKERSFDSACLASAAKAYAQSGQFDKALALQRKALERYKFGRVSAKRLALLEKYVDMYERGEKPYTEPDESRK